MATTVNFVVSLHGEEIRIGNNRSDSLYFISYCVQILHIFFINVRYMYFCIGKIKYKFKHKFSCAH